MERNDILRLNHCLVVFILFLMVKMNSVHSQENAWNWKYMGTILAKKKKKKILLCFSMVFNYVEASSICSGLNILSLFSLIF